MLKRVNNRFSKWVRLRQTGDETTITIKKIVNSAGVYDLDSVLELEFSVSDIDEGKCFLEDLGYFFDRHQMKMRLIYNYKNTEIVIDKWPFIPAYIEIEGPTEDDIFEVVRLLGFSDDDAIVINTDDVYSKYNIDVYADEYRDLKFSNSELKEVESYMQFD